MPGGRAGIVSVQHVLLGKSAMAEHWKTIRSVNTEFETAETSDKTVITLDTSPTRMPVGWVNFLRQSLCVVGVFPDGGRFEVTGQVVAGSRGWPSASMTKVSKKFRPCLAAVDR